LWCSCRKAKRGVRSRRGSTIWARIPRRGSRARGPKPFPSSPQRHSILDATDCSCKKWQSVAVHSMASTFVR
jgi:hypothetical protein